MKNRTIRQPRRDLSIAYDIQADALNAAGEREEALKWFNKDLEISKALADSAPDNSLWRHDLAVTYAKLGRLLESLGQNELALDAYDKAIVREMRWRSRRACASNGFAIPPRRHEYRGLLLNRLGRSTEAILAFRRSLAIRERLASSSVDVQWQRELESAYRKTREALLTSNHSAEALETAEQQLFATSLATDTEPGKNERVARALISLGWTSILARDIPRAVWAGEQAVALAPDLPNAKLNYAHALMYSGDAAAAREVYLGGLTGDSETSGQWRQMIRKDFKDLSERQLQNPLMAEVDREIGP